MASEILLENKDSLQIEMTVAIPAYKSDRIIALALESLNNQINIDFGWELIIFEEFSDSKKLIESYSESLPNCQKITYKHFNKRLLPLDRWLSMVKYADTNSRIFVMHSVDEYSSPKRLWIHYQHFQNKDCYISTQFLGLYYNLLTGKEIFYYGINKEKPNSSIFTQQHLSLAILTRDMKRIRRCYLTNGIEHYIKTCIGKLHGTNFGIKKHIFTDYEIDKNNWKYSFFTHGYYGLTNEQEMIYKNPSGIFLPFNRNVIVRYDRIEDYIPNYVLQFIKQFRQKLQNQV